MKKINKERENQPVSEATAEVVPKGRKRGKTDEEKQVKSVATKRAKTGEDITPKLTTNHSAEPQRNAESSVNAPIAIPKPVIDPSRHANTVFLSNLDFSVTEDDIRTTMSASGTVTEIRLVRDYKQRSKGYCYVEFSSQVTLKSVIT